MKFAAVGVFLLSVLVLANDPGRQDEVGQRSSSNSQAGGNRLNTSSRKQSDSSSSGSASSSSILDGLGDALKNIFSSSSSTSSSSSSPQQTDTPSSSRSRDDSGSSDSGSSSRSRSASSRSSDSRTSDSNNGRIHGISRDNDALVDEKALTSKSKVASPLHADQLTSSNLQQALPQTLLAVSLTVFTLSL